MTAANRPPVIRIVEVDAFRAVAGDAVNPYLTSVTTGDPDGPGLVHLVSRWQEAPHPRVLAAVDYMEALDAARGSIGLPGPGDRPILFQGEDVPVRVPSVSWETRTDWTEIVLVPDLYYFSGGGYEDFVPVPVAWEDRTPSFFWRGSTTGLFHQQPADLNALPRYRLCALLAGLGAAGDAGIIDIVQAADADAADAIRARLDREGLLRPYVAMAEMARHRHVLDIDGNSNSWNFMMKLRLGSCVLRVDSAWKQWFSDRLVAWIHYVPVAADLSDLIEKTQWCLAHPQDCEAIARQGARFAREMLFADEMRRAARLVFAPA